MATAGTPNNKSPSCCAVADPPDEPVALAEAEALTDIELELFATEVELEMTEAVLAPLAAVVVAEAAAAPVSSAAFSKAVVKEAGKTQEAPAEVQIETAK